MISHVFLLLLIADRETEAHRRTCWPTLSLKLQIPESGLLQAFIEHLLCIRHLAHRQESDRSPSGTYEPQGIQEVWWRRPSSTQLSSHQRSEEASEQRVARGDETPQVIGYEASGKALEKAKLKN